MANDCSNVLVYQKERDRMCDAQVHAKIPCFKCELWLHGGCIYDRTYLPIIKQEHIDIVQKWSDNYKVKPKVSDFIKLFPNAELENGFPTVCVFNLDKTMDCECWRKNCEECAKEFWDTGGNND